MSGFLSNLEDSAALRFYDELQNDRFVTTRCKRCALVFFPPRIICPDCLGEKIEWVRLSGRGRLYAFTQQHQSLAHSKPQVVGIVDLEGARGRIFSIIDAPWEELEIGLPVRIDFFESPFGFKMHKFVLER